MQMWKMGRRLAFYLNRWPDLSDSELFGWRPQSLTTCFLSNSYMVPSSLAEVQARSGAGCTASRARSAQLPWPIWSGLLTDMEPTGPRAYTSQPVLVLHGTLFVFPCPSLNTIVGKFVSLRKMEVSKSITFLNQLSVFSELTNAIWV